MRKGHFHITFVSIYRSIFALKKFASVIQRQLLYNLSAIPVECDTYLEFASVSPQITANLHDVSKLLRYRSNKSRQKSSEIGASLHLRFSPRDRAQNSFNKMYDKNCIKIACLQTGVESQNDFV